MGPGDTVQNDAVTTSQETPAPDAAPVENAPSEDQTGSVPDDHPDNDANEVSESDETSVDELVQDVDTNVPDTAGEDSQDGTN